MIFFFARKSFDRWQWQAAIADIYLNILQNILGKILEVPPVWRKIQATVFWNKSAKYDLLNVVQDFFQVLFWSHLSSLWEGWLSIDNWTWQMGYFGCCLCRAYQMKAAFLSFWGKCENFCRSRNMFANKRWRFCWTHETDMCCARDPVKQARTRTILSWRPSLKVIETAQNSGVGDRNKQQWQHEFFGEILAITFENTEKLPVNNGRSWKIKKITRRTKNMKKKTQRRENTFPPQRNLCSTKYRCGQLWFVSHTWNFLGILFDVVKMFWSSSLPDTPESRRNAQEFFIFIVVQVPGFLESLQTVSEVFHQFPFQCVILLRVNIVAKYVLPTILDQRTISSQTETDTQGISFVWQNFACCAENDNWICACSVRIEKDRGSLNDRSDANLKGKTKSFHEQEHVSVQTSASAATILNYVAQVCCWTGTLGEFVFQNLVCGRGSEFLAVWVVVCFESGEVDEPAQGVVQNTEKQFKTNTSVRVAKRIQSTHKNCMIQQQQQMRYASDVTKKPGKQNGQVINNHAHAVVSNIQKESSLQSNFSVSTKIFG